MVLKVAPPELSKGSFIRLQQTSGHCLSRFRHGAAALDVCSGGERAET